MVVIVADDLNHYVVEGSRHPQALTPNIARLAQRGVRFTNAHANSTVCSPSRASLLSGYAPSTSNKYQSHLDFRDHAVLASAKLLPEYFRDRGYSSYIAGKVFHPGEEDFTVLGRRDKASQPSSRRDRNSGYVGPDESYGPTPWDGVLRLQFWNGSANIQRPSFLIPWGVEGRDWQFGEPWRIDLLPGGRWNSNPDFPSQLQRWDQGFGRLSNPPRFTASMNSRYPASHSYAGFATWNGPFHHISATNRSRMPDEDTAIWAADLLSGKRVSIPGFTHAQPINKHSFVMMLGLQKTHAPLYLPDEFFDEIVREAGITSIDDVRLPPLIADLPAAGNDRSDVPGASSKGSGGSEFKALMDAGSTASPFPDLVNAGQTIQLDRERIVKSFILSYLAAILQLDRQVGRILDAIDSDPQLKANTIIVFTSDHGYHFGEKGLFGKNTLWNDSTQVPLVIVDPRAEFDASRGLSSDIPVSLVDLYPTLVSLAGLPTLPGRPGMPSIDGTNLRAALLNPSSPSLTRQPYAISSASGDTHDSIPADPNLRNHTIRSDAWRYTLNRDGSEELYDQKADPNEWYNRAADPAYRWVIDMLRPVLKERTGRTN